MSGPQTTLDEYGQKGKIYMPEITPKRDIAAAVSESAHNIVMLMPSGDQRRRFVEQRLWLLLKDAGVRYDN